MKNARIWYGEGEKEPNSFGLFPSLGTTNQALQSSYGDANLFRILLRIDPFPTLPLLSQNNTLLYFPVPPCHLN